MSGGKVLTAPGKSYVFGSEDFEEGLARMWAVLSPKEAER
jgi:hypothetical protein